MASLSEMVEYAKAKQRPNGLADIANHFIIGANQGFQAGQKAKLQQIDQILKSAQAEEAAQKSRGLKIQNDLWTSVIDQAKGQGDVPLTAGETINGRTVGVNSVGQQANATKSNTTLTRLAQMFMPTDPNSQVTTKFKMPGGLGEVVVGPKPKVTESSPTATAREDRILREKAFSMALQMTQAEDPMAAQPNPKYLRLSYQNLGKNPDDYIPKQSIKPPPNLDPWGLLAGQPQGGQ